MRHSERECQLTVQALLQLSDSRQMYTGDCFIREVFKTIICESVLPEPQSQGLAQMRHMYADVLGGPLLIRILQFKATDLDKQRASLAASQLSQPTRAALMACLTKSERMRYWCLKPLQVFRN